MERSDVLRKIQALLDKASATGFSAESDAFRKKADDLMLAYQIEQFELQKVKKVTRSKPEVRTFNVAPYDSVVREELSDMFGVIARHVGSRPVYYGLMSRDKKTKVSAQVVGFPEDLDYLEMMFVSLQLQMANNLEPKPSPDNTFDENLVLLKEAGVKWKRIHEILCPDVPFERRHGVRYTGIYTRYCKEHEKSRMYTSPVTYQRNFSMGFVHEVAGRLAEIRSRQQAEQGGSGTGMDLMLRDKSQVVDDMFKEMFKNLSSHKRSSGKFDNNAYARGVGAGQKADLGQRSAGSRKELG